MSRELTSDQYLNVYSVHRPLSSQWEYKPGIGAESLSSEVDTYEGMFTEEGERAKIWQEMHESVNGPGMKEFCEITNFRNPALSLGTIEFNYQQSRIIICW